jgi:hypothetical protein
MSKQVLLLTFSFLLMVSIGLASERTFVVGVENIDHYPHYTLQEGEWAGLGREILDEFAGDRGYTFIYKPFPVNRLMQQSWQQEVDFMFPDNPLWLAEQKKDIAITYSTSFVEVVEGTMVLPENLGAGIDAIKTLGTVTGFTAASYLPLLESGKVQMDYARDSRFVLAKTLDGRTDGSFLAVDSAGHVLKTILNQPDGLVFDTSLPYDTYSYLLSTTMHPEVIAEFNTFVHNNADLLAELKNKYHIFSMD